MSCPGQQHRKYPRKQPPAWKPPVPRWQLSFPATATEVHTLYVGVQSHTDSNPADNPSFAAAVASITDWLAAFPPDVLDAFITETTLAHDLPHSRVWVAYFTSRAAFTAARDALDLPGRWRSLASSAAPSSSTSSSPSSASSSSENANARGIGLWTESFSTPLTRLETNYAGLHEKPGLARLPQVAAERHELSAYWGAARDRIPASAEDLFEVPGSELPEVPTTTNGATDGKGQVCLKEVETDSDGKPKTKWHVTDALTTSSSLPEVQIPAEAAVPRGYGQVLRGTNYDNITHIRSGQCWAQCPADEAAAYTREGGLQEKLMKGMAYLWTHPAETGTLGLRWLRNVLPSNQQQGGAEVRGVNETCGAGFFRNLKDLEIWSSTHPSHMAIFTGAHKHAREWGPDRKFMTWHEVSVLKSGEAAWEYVNCDPRTGVVRFVGMDSVEELREKASG